MLTAAAWERRCSKNATVSGASCIGIQALRVERRAMQRRQKTDRKTFVSPRRINLTNKKEKNHENYFANVDTAGTRSGVSHTLVRYCSENQKGRENAGRLR